MTPLSKRLIIALAISGALNLLAFGLFVGGAIRRAKGQDVRARVEQRERGPRGDGPRGDGPRGDGPREGKRGDRGDREGKRDDGPPERGRRRNEQPLAKLFAERPEEMIARHRATGEARKAVSEALELEPFDAAALERSLGTLRTETAATQALLHQKVLDKATKGDAESRKALARGFERTGPPGL